MKKFIYIVILSFFANIVNAQWIKIFSDANAAFNTLQFTDVMTGYAVGEKSVSPYDASVYKTTNSGNNWVYLAFNVPGRPPVNDLCFINANTGYMCGESQYIYKTTNGGTNWIYYLASGYINQSFEAIYFVNEQTGYAGGNNNLTIKTTNGGMNWTALQPASSNVHAIFFLSSNTGFRLDASGYFYKTTDGGSSWTSFLLKDTNNATYSLESMGFIDGNTGYIAGAGSSPVRGAIFKTTNGGANWRNVLITNNQFNDVYTNTSTNVYAVGVTRDVYKSTNGGATWFTQYLSLATPNTASLFFIDTGTGFITEDGSIFKTINGGLGSENHSLLGVAKYSDNNQPVTSGSVKAIKLNKSNGSIIVVDSTQLLSDGTYSLNHVPSDSVDIGVYPNSSSTTWDYVITHYPSTIYWEKATLLYPTGNIINVNIGAIRITSTTANNSVNGKVMSIMNSTVSNLKDVNLYARLGNNFVRCAVSDGNGVYHLQSLPSGTLKIIANRMGFTGDSTTVTLTPVSNIDSINFYLRYLYIGIKKIENTVPSEFKLGQNYPNPFNSMTKINIDIPDGFPLKTYWNDRIVLKVFNILGRDIATLVNEVLTPGMYEVQWNSSNFPSGVYFYKLTAGDFSEAKRMLLIK